MSAPGSRNIAKFGLATAVALSPLVAGEAEAAICTGQSDSLQLGSQTARTICENAEPSFIQGDSISFIEGFQTISSTKVITLTEPGSTAISDIVTAVLTGSEGSFMLTVTLQSDGETALSAPTTVDFSTAETGTAQNFGPEFERLFGLTGGGFPTVNVTSDVPEPGSLGIFGAALAALGLLRRRRTARGRGRS